MGKVVIKKRIELQNVLGDDYKESYVIFSSLPISEVEGILTKVEGFKGSEKDTSADAIKPINTMIEFLQDKFIEGKFQGDDGVFDLTKDNVKEFDIATVIYMFRVLTGQAADPKVPNS